MCPVGTGGYHKGADPLKEPAEEIRRLYAYVAYRIGPGPDAEDVVSETIERALRYRDSFDPSRGSGRAWLTGIASRVLLDRNNERGLHVEDGLDPDELSMDEDVSVRVQRRVDLHDAIRLLDGRSRDLLALRYGADLKAREIADLFGLSVNAVEVALHRALGRLRAVMDGTQPTRASVTRPAEEA